MCITWMWMRGVVSAGDRTAGEFEVDENWVRYAVVEPHIAQITIS